MNNMNEARHHGGRALLTALDREILRHALRHGALRRAHLPALTGASPWTVKERTAFLAHRGLIASSAHEATLRCGATVSNANVRLWEATALGARHVAEWTAAGTDVVVRVAPLNRHTAGATTVNDLLAADDLSAWYSSAGYRTLTWLEAQAVDRARSGADTMAGRPWRVGLSDGSIHVPAVGAVAPSGERWWLEVAWPWVRRDWAPFIAACVETGHSLVVHCVAFGAVHSILQACEELGLRTTGGSKLPGVLLLADGRVRIARWLPGPAGLRGPETWHSLLPATPPAGLAAWPAALQRPWRGRRIPIDVSAPRESISAM